MRSQLLPRQRQRLIVQRLWQDGAVETAKLARELGASTVTVRRDLDALIDRGLARRVHGGAVAASQSDEVRTAKVIPLPHAMTGADTAERHVRCAQRLLALAERRLLRNKREEAQEWRALAELHIRLAECVRTASPSSVDAVSETVAL